MQSLKSIVVAVVALIVAGSAQAQAPEKKEVKLGVGGANSLYYLPLALTEKLGYFKEQGPQRRDQRLQGWLAVAAGAGEQLGGRRHRRLRAYPAHAGQRPGDRRCHRARPLSGHLAGGEEGPHGQDQDHRRPQGSAHRRHRAGFVHQHDRAVSDGQSRLEARRRLLHRCRRRPWCSRRHAQGRNRRHLQHRPHDRHAGGQWRRRHHGGYAHDRRRDQGIRRHDVGGRRLLPQGLRRQEPQHRAGAGQRFLQDPALDRQGDARADHRKRAARNTGWATRRSTRLPPKPTTRSTRATASSARAASSAPSPSCSSSTRKWRPRSSSRRKPSTTAS